MTAKCKLRARVLRSRNLNKTLAGTSVILRYAQNREILKLHAFVLKKEKKRHFLAVHRVVQVRALHTVQIPAGGLWLDGVYS